MSRNPITSAFNDAYIAEVYESFQADPSAVDESWRQFFQFAETLAGTSTVGAASALRKVSGATSLVQAIRTYGHLAVPLDPLGTPPLGAAELTPEFHGIMEEDLDSIPGHALGFDDVTVADAVARLRTRYSGTIGAEFEHISDETEREWFRRQIEGEEARFTLTDEEKKSVLRRLTAVDGLERFLGRTFPTMKRFSIEGTDAMVPMLDAAIEKSAEAGTRQVVIGMAHRGRINVLAHVLDKPYASLLAEFEGQHPHSNSPSDTGDVKYHLGFQTRKRTGNVEVDVMLAPNPSHLEFVNPVVNGVARALQRVPGAAPGTRDELRVLPVLVHGDAAFPGEGVVAETFNLSGLRGYRTGGTLHIIANNQVGFTTDPHDGRSTHHASDLAKGFEVPVLHVNGDDAEACVTSMWLAISYRTRFHKDVVINLVGFRRHGHNETDEPVFTQPLLYQKIKEHPSPRDAWATRLVGEGLIDENETKRLDDELFGRLQSTHNAVKSGRSQPPEHEPGDQSAVPAPRPFDTAVSVEKLIAANESLLTWPPQFQPMSKLVRSLERRRAAMGAAGGIDWGHAEALAWASLLDEGISVRITGQDVERGTFSHRQAVLRDATTGEAYTPLQHLPHATSAHFEIHNSPLSETAVMGFEYGFSVAASDALVLWEAQFGDFVNVAQPIIDQFLVADRAKWGQDSALVLLLPHGYEGQGPEHSSARLERFLQLCAEGNLRVAYPTSPAQYFHILRRQALVKERRPLVLMQPKSLLRLPEAASKLSDLSEGSFRTVIDDGSAAERADQVHRLVFCSGKLYYDLVAQAGEASHIALVRVEELYPWPADEVRRILENYGAAEEIVWAQEEPRNMGAWTYVEPRLRELVGNGSGVRYIGRPDRSSPAEGYLALHQEHQARIVADVLEQMPQPAVAQR